MALTSTERPPLLAVEEPLARRQPPRPARRGLADRGGWWLYWLHIALLTGISPSNVLLGLSVLVAAPGRAVRSIARRSCRPLLVAVLAYVLQLGISIVFSFDPHRSMGDLSELFSFCTLLLGLAFARGERAIRLLVDAALLLASFESLLALVQLARNGGPDLAHRVHGTLPHYMTFCGVVLVADLLLLGRVATRGLGRVAEGGTGWRALALLPINAAILASLTRSAWMGLAAGLLALLVVSRRRLLLWGIPAVLLLLLVFPPTVMERVASIGDPNDATTADRIAMARAGAEMIHERPWVGQGPDMVRARYPLFRQPDAVRKNVPHLHDAFLEIAAEKGLPGLAVLLVLLGLPLVRATRMFHREGGSSGARADLWLGCIAVIVGFAVAGLFEDNWGDAEVRRMLLMAMAIPFGLGSAEDEGEEPSSPPTVLRFP